MIDFNNIYYKRSKEEQKLYFKENTLFLRDEHEKEVSIFEFSNVHDFDDFRIFQVLEYKNYAVIFINWALPRNILVADMKDQKVIWQAPAPKIGEKNQWIEYFIQDDKPDVIYCKAYRYVAGFKIPTGELVDEWFSKSADPRDF